MKALQEEIRSLHEEIKDLTASEAYYQDAGRGPDERRSGAGAGKQGSVEGGTALREENKALREENGVFQEEEKALLEEWSWRSGLRFFRGKDSKYASWKKYIIIIINKAEV